MLIHRRLRARIAVLGLVMLPLLTVVAGAAPPDGSDKDASRKRGERTMAVLRQMDTNRNGMIDADELNAQQKAFLERIQRKVGMETTLPVSIEKLATALQNYYAAKDAKSAAQTPGGSPSASSSSPASGFGAASTSSSLSGFGGGSGATPTSSSGSSTAGFSSSSSFGGSTGSNPAEAKIRRYAEMLLKQYDKNKNGVLEREEWSEMRGDWKSADLNGDGILTVDEIAAHLMGLNQRRSQQSTASVSTSSSTTVASAGSGSTSSWRPAGSDVRKPYRFLSPTERLQGKGLPDWFLQKDVNGDGQVTMAEFSSTWNDAVAAEFATYDLNNDGVITVEECLHAEKMKSQSQAKASPATQSQAIASAATASPATALPTTASPATTAPATAPSATTAPATASPATASPTTAPPATAPPATQSPAAR